MSIFAGTFKMKDKKCGNDERNKIYLAARRLAPHAMG
jgi:hypothetical protein